MPQPWFEFKQRNEHKGPFGNTWVRQRQGRSLHDGGSMEQYVDVERAWPLVPLPGAIPSEFRFYRLQALEKFHGAKFCIARYHYIEEIRLV